MQTVIKIEACVLQGSRLELSHPSLPVGARVEVQVTLPEPKPTSEMNLLEFLDSRPPSTKTLEEWKKEDEEFIQNRRDDR